MPTKQAAKPSRPRKRRKAGGSLLERRSIRLTDDLAVEIDELAERTYRTVPALVRLLLRIGLEHREDLARYEA